MDIVVFVGITFITLLTILWLYGFFGFKKNKKMHPLLGIPIGIGTGIISLIAFFAIFGPKVGEFSRLVTLMLSTSALALFSLQSLIIFFILRRYLKSITYQDISVVIGIIIFLPIIIYKLCLILPVFHWLRYWLNFNKIILLCFLLAAGTQSVLFALWFKNNRPSPIKALVLTSFTTWLLLYLTGWLIL